MKITVSRLIGASVSGLLSSGCPATSALALIFTAFPGIVLASEAIDRQIHLEILANIPLEDALIEWGKKAGMTVMMSTEGTSARVSQGVQGIFSERLALDLILKGSGLTYIADSRSVRIVPLNKLTSVQEFVKDSGSLVPVRYDADASGIESNAGNTPSDTAFGNSGESEDGQHINRDSEKLEQVVVTAQKRAERLQDVPISVSVLSGNDLDHSTFTSTEDALATVPGLATLTDQVTGGTQLSIRGVSSSAAFVGGSTPVAYYIDGVPFALIRSAIVPDMNVYDLQRIEVLSGPQGTLYGASALNGVIRILTNDSNLNDFDFKGRAIVSTTDGGGENYDGDMAVNIPLIDSKLGIRLVAGEEHQSGWIDSNFGNHINSQVIGSDRLKINAQPSDSLSVGLSVWHSQVMSDGPPLAAPNYRTTELYGGADSNSFNAYGLDLTDDLSSFSVSSTTSYLVYTDSGMDDPSAYGIDFTFLTLSHSRVYSEELNFTSKIDSPWRWSGGLFYRNAEDSYYQSLFLYPSTTARFPSSEEPDDAFSDTSKSEAVYGELGRSFFSDSLEISAGARYFHDDEGSEADVPALGSNGLPVSPARVTSTATTPRAILTWKPSRDFTAYLSYGQGFRSGIPQDYLVQKIYPYPAAAPDKLTNYEIGIKGNAFNQAVTYTAAAFFIDWKGVQQQIGVLAPNGLNTLVITNGQSASGPGAEFAITARPIKGFEFNTTFSWNDLKFDHNVYSNGNELFFAGDRLNVSPEFTAGFSAEYTFSLGDSGLRGQISASENYTSTLDSIDIRLGETVNDESNSLLLARAKLSLLIPDHWTLSLFADNLANYNGNILTNSSASSYDTRTAPRTVGVRVDYNLR